jgi:hypothetical protein
MRLHLIHRYALSELQKDVESELQSLPESERDSKRTQFAIFVVHNKLMPKLWELPPNVLYVPSLAKMAVSSGYLFLTRYFTGADVGNVW